ncbi:MAG: DUF5665 domain-containing protein [Candidatus Microsaccharimonas sp.]
MLKRAARRVKSENELGARRAVLEDLFYDFHSSRRQVYWMNFTRGLFFGVGSILGGTLIVALILWILNLLVDLPGGIGDFVEYIVSLVQNKQ